MPYSKLIIFFLNFLDFFQQKKIIKKLNKIFNKPIVVFDIGAHHGETVKLFVKKLKIKKIYSFEASPKNYEILKNNSKKYPSEKLEIFNFGIGNEILAGYINQTSESSSSTINELNNNSKYFKRKLKILNVKNKESFSKKIPIKLITLDNFIEKNRIENIDLLKIDTEGFELKVIKGLERNHHMVQYIYFEHHYDDMIKKNYTFKDINAILKKFGFKKVFKSKMIFRKSFEYIYKNSLF